KRTSRQTARRPTKTRSTRRPPLEARPEPDPGPASPRTGRYRRVLLKLSGEALAGESGYGIDQLVLAGFAAELRDVHAVGGELAVVIGGGNIFPGLARSARGMGRPTSHCMGKLATAINAPHPP